MKKNTYHCVFLRGAMIIVLSVLSVAGHLQAMFTAKLPPAITKRLEKSWSGMRKKSERAILGIRKKEVEEQKEHGQVHIYDESLRHEYVLTKDLWNTSGMLKEQMESFGQTANIDAPSLVVGINFSTVTMARLFEFISFYLETDEKERKEKLKEQIAQIDFKTLVSVLELAIYLLIEGNIFNVIVEGVSEKIIALNGINQSCYTELKQMNRPVREQILTDEVWDTFLQEMKRPVGQYCFSKRFSNLNPYIYPSEDLKGVAEKLSLNADGSFLLYMLSDPENKQRYLYVLNSKNIGMIQNLGAVRQYSCWINKNQFAYSNFAEENKLTIYDCQSNAQVDKTISSSDQKHIAFNILDLISSSDVKNEQKVIFLYSSYNSREKIGSYGLGFYNHKNRSVKHRDLSILGEEIKLLSYSNKMVRYLIFEKLMYGKSGYKVSLCQLPMYEDGFGDFDDLEIKPKTKEISPEIKERFLNCVVSPNGSKIAFTSYQDICIQSLDKFDDTWMILPGKQPILSLTFSEDSQFIMIGYGDGTVIAFDVDNGIKIGELSYQKEQAFNENYALSFSDDGKTFALSGNSFKYRKAPDHLLIWKSLFNPQTRNEYFSVLDTWKTNFSLEKVVLCKFLCDQSREKKRELEFADQEKKEFQQLDYEIQEMLTDVGYVAPGQSKRPEDESEIIPTKAKQKSENFVQRMRNAAAYYLGRFIQNIQGLR